MTERRGNPYKLTDLSEGILQGIANTIVPINSVYLSVNLDFKKKKGYAVVRKGYERLGNEVSSSNSCNGIHHFIKTDGNEKLLVAFGTNIFSYEDPNWEARETITDSKTRFLTFANTVLALDGTNKITSEDGETWVSTVGKLDLNNMPTGKYALNWKDRIYLAGESANPDRVYFSSLYEEIEDATRKIFWKGTVWDEDAEEWVEGDELQYFDVDPEDGAGGIVGLGKVPGYLLIFKNRSIHRWDGKSLSAESLIDIGTQSQESLTRSREAIYFWNERGVYATQGGYPQKISTRIQEIIDAVDPNYGVSAWSDVENVYFSIGDISLSGLNIKNCVICFNIEEQTWELYSFKNNFVLFGEYISPKKEFIAGSNDGSIYKLLKADDDNGNEVEYHLQFQNIEVGHRSRLKDISEIVIFNRAIRNGTLYGRSEEQDFKPLGTISNDVEVIKNDISGRYLDFRISGTTKVGERPEIKGLEITQHFTNLSQQK